MTDTGRVRRPGVAETGAEAGSARRKAGVGSRKPAQILPAASDLFLDRGFEAVTMDMVAKAAGVSKATLYVHFQSKEDLFAAFMREEARRVNEAIWTPCEAIDDVEDVLRQVAKNFVAVFLTGRTMACKRAILGALPRFPDAGRIIFEAGPAKMAETIAAFLAAAHDRGRLDVPDPAQAAGQFMSLTRGDFELAGVLSMPPPSQDEIDAAIEATLAMFLARYGKR